MDTTVPVRGWDDDVDEDDDYDYFYFRYPPYDYKGGGMDRDWIVVWVEILVLCSVTIVTTYSIGATRRTTRAVRYKVFVSRWTMTSWVDYC